MTYDETKPERGRVNNLITMLNYSGKKNKDMKIRTHHRDQF